MSERLRWPLWLPVPIGLGIILYFTLPFEPSLWLLVTTPLLTVAAWLLRHHTNLFLPVLVMVLMAAGFNAGQIETQLDQTPMLDREIGPVAVTGRLMFTEVLPEGVRLTLKDLQIGHIPLERTPIKIHIKLKNKDLTDVPPTGSRINLWAQVGPFSEPVMPGAHDFRWQSFYKQLGGLGWSFSAIKLVDANPPSTSWRDDFSLAFEGARRTLAQHVYNQLSGDVAAMTATRLNGEQTSISAQVIENMRVAGLAHLLSTSGFHVTIMGLLVYFPLRAVLALIPWVALRFPIKKIAAAGAIISTMGYTFLVGSPPATLRSMLMTGIAMLAIITDRQAAVMRLIMLSAALVMLIAPDAMLGPSFQMSFAAVLCLIAIYERPPGWEPILATPLLPPWLHAIAKNLWAIMRTSLVATAATTGFAVYHFQTLSFYGFIANTLAIPLTSFWVMPCILMAYVTAPFNLDGWFIRGAGWGTGIVIKIATMVAGWPYALIHAPAMPVVALVLITLGGLWLCLWQKRWRYYGLIAVAAGALYPIYTPQPDVMVAADGKAWAAKLDNGTLVVSNLDHDPFTVKQWQERLGNPPLMDSYELPPGENELRCDDLGCVYYHGAHILAMPILESATLEDCQQASVVITPVAVKQCGSVTKPVTLIDDPVLWHHGAQAIYFDGDTMRIEYVHDRRGERPWSVGWKKERSITPD